MNWKHSFYEIYALTFGQAFTIDEAHRLLSEQREDRLFSIASAQAESKRAQAKVIDAKVTVRDYNKKADTKANMRRAEAFLLETDARIIIARPCMDMARAELRFIESLIEYIDGRNLRLYPQTELGYQLVQEMEIAFDLAWQFAYGGAHPDVMRNIFAHPKADAITQLGQAQNNVLPTRKALTLGLAKVYCIDEANLAISVNVFEKITESIKGGILTKYSEASKTAFASLEEKASVDTPRSAPQSIGTQG